MQHMNLGTLELNASSTAIMRGSNVKRNPPPSHPALTEALQLSAEILKNIELSELPLTNIALKVGLSELAYQRLPSGPSV
jgi:hypothetical protein